MNSSLAIDVVRRVEDSLAVGLASTLDLTLRRRPGNSISILCYHRITCTDGTPTWNVPPDRFEAQLSGLLTRGFRPLRLGDLAADFNPSPAKPGFVVTFDDGYESVRASALPVLKRLRVPATVFLATAYIGSGQPFPFDDWNRAGDDQMRSAWVPLDWESCDDLRDSGLVDLGTHTHTHRDFRKTVEEFESDLITSVTALRERYNLHRVPFAFPFGVNHLGFCTEALTEAATRCGVSCALSLDPKPIRPGQDPFFWGRVLVRPYDTSQTLETKSGRFYGTIRSCLHRITKPLRPTR
jgi:peptidoglycan/xylan/chitin deacetylase (PgdA/CDA1 family)